MSASPPPDAPEFRGKTLTPISPKPVHYPSPSNVRILERQMEPSFEASAAAAGLLSGQSALSGGIASMNGFAHQDAPGPATQAEVGVSLSGSEAGVQNGQSQRSDQITAEHHNTNSLLAQHSQSLDSASGEATAAPADEIAASVHLPSNEPTLSAAVDQHAEQQNSNIPQADTGSASNASAGDIIAGGLDFQSLLNRLAQHPTVFPQPVGGSEVPEAIPNAPSIPAALAGNPNLPPRPPPQEKPVTHPNYNPADDIRAYHPHSQQNPAASYRAQNPPHALNTTIPGMSPQAPPFQPTPSSATFPGQSPGTPSYRQRDAFERRPDADTTDSGSVQWSADVERMYAEFLQDESVNVAEGRWDKFPVGSRLFVGNLPTEKVNKRDLFERFYRYGKLAQISIKQAYGFVQFLDADACYQALNGEQGMTVAGRKMHLEISKPQKNTREGGRNRDNRRRSRSPDYNRSGQRGIDRYTSGGGQSGSPRDQYYRRSRDDYRPGRSPSPDRYGRRSHDRYDGRRRSPSPRGRQDRYGSFGAGDESTLPLPRRTPEQVPDVQFIILNQTDRNFVTYLDGEFKRASLRTDVLFLNNLPEELVMERQILEGVRAIVRVTPQAAQKGTIPLRIFHPSVGGSNIRFDDYSDLPAAIAAQLVIQVKNATPAPSAYTAPAPSYGMPPVSYGYGQPQPAPSIAPQQTQAPSQANLSSLLSALGATGTSNISNYPPAAQQQQRQQPQPTPQAGAHSTLTPDISRLLGQLGQQPAAAHGNTTTTYGQPPAQQHNPYSNNPTVAPLLGGLATGSTGLPTPPAQNHQPMQTSSSGGQQPDMAEIMAQLTKYSR